MTTHNDTTDLIKLFEGEGGTISINKSNIQEHNEIVKKISRRGINRTLTEEQIKERKKQQQQKRNLTYYLKHKETIRRRNLKKYHTTKKEHRKIGRPLKYV